MPGVVPPLPLDPPGDHSGIDWHTHVVLQSNDEPPQEFKVSRDACQMSGLLKDVLDEVPEGDPITVPILNVDGKTLRYVILFMEHHWNHPLDVLEKPLRQPIAELIAEWDRNFIFTDLVKDGREEQHELLISCIMAANFLNVRSLLDLTCATVASMMRSKTTEEVRRLFQIENDFTAEEAEKIKDENRWCEES